MGTIEYKGYVAEVEYDDAAKLHFGSVVNTEPYSIVAFELPDGYDVYREFQISVVVYLDSCEEDGAEPLQPLRGYYVRHLFMPRPPVSAT